MYLDDLCGPDNGSTIRDLLYITEHKDAYLERASLWFKLCLPFAMSGILINLPCIAYYLRHQRKTLGDRLMIGLISSDIVLCAVTVVNLKFFPESLFTNYKLSLVVFIVYDTVMFMSFMMPVVVWYCRMIGIFRPLHHVRGKNVLILLLCFLAGFLVAIPAMEYFILRPLTEACFCRDRKPFSSFYTELDIAFGLFGLVAFLAIAGTSIIISLKAIRKLSVNIAENDSVTEMKRQASITVTLYLICQICSLLPMIGVNAYFLMIEIFTKKLFNDGWSYTEDGDHCAVFQLYLTINVILVLNAIVNAFIHIFRNKNLRNRFKTCSV